MSRYQSYLRSDHWRETRERALNRAGRECEGCGESGQRLHVHHVSYERIGDERPSDLRVLCTSCHREEHPDMEWGGDDEWSWLSEDACGVCGYGIARLQRCGEGEVAVMCLRCGNEERRPTRRPVQLGQKEPVREPREIECPQGCTDKKFRTEYDMSQHLKDRHGTDWSDTPAG